MARDLIAQDKSPFGDDLTIAVGLVTIEWSYLSYMLQEILAALVDMNDDYAHIVTHRMDARPMMDAISRIANERFTKHSGSLDDLRAAIIAVDDCRKKRNGLIHNRWNAEAKYSEPTQTVIRTVGSKRNQKIVIEREVRDATEIQQLAENIMNASMLLSEWRVNHLFPILGWPAYPDRST